MKTIPESDWKKFKQLHEVALERYCERVLGEIRSLIDARDGTWHDRYLDVRKVMKERDKQLGIALGDMRRSTAMGHLFQIRSLGLMTDEELAGFTPDTQQTIKTLLRTNEMSGE